MPKTVTYTDSRGRRRRLSFTQGVYLQEADRTLRCGWGGLSSTQTVRVLAERGLVHLHEFGPGDWEATTTRLGRRVLDQWGC